jgi:glyceraldehyde 3-phosphate dehydrogenase
MVRIAINGFGRIGRLFLRTALEKAKHFQVVSINDLVSPEHLAYLLKYDSVHHSPPFEVRVEGGGLICAGKRIEVFSEKNPEVLPYRRLGVDYVLESTGHFTQRKEAERHLMGGAKGVILSAPGKGDIPTYVYGVNHTNLDAEEDVSVISNASCTTNCLALLAKVLVDAFGIEEGLMTTVHALTASQPSVDGASKRDWRGGRAASLNIIPSTTGAAQAVIEAIPALKGKLTGMAFRVPVADVSVVDLTVRLSQPTSYEAICQAMQCAAEGSMRGLLEYCDEEVVSSDFIGNSHSCIFDRKAGISLNSCFYKVIAWYDNEIGYSNRLLDLIDYLAIRAKKSIAVQAI